MRETPTFSTVGKKVRRARRSSKHHCKCPETRFPGSPLRPSVPVLVQQPPLPAKGAVRDVGFGGDGLGGGGEANAFHCEKQTERQEGRMGGDGEVMGAPLCVHAGCRDGSGGTRDQLFCYSTPNS